MTKLSIQKKFLITAAATMPLIFIFGIWRSVDLLSNSINSVLVFCVKKVEMLLSYILHPDNLLLTILGGLLIVGFIKGIVFLVSQLRNNHKLIKEFQTKIINNIKKSNQSINVVVINDSRPFALTVGFLKPIIYISKDLVKQLDSQELESVIFHEHYHQINHHPLVKLLVGVFKSFLFFVPIMPVITKQLALQQEALADNKAIEKTSRESLVSAFLKISGELNGLNKIPATVSQFLPRHSDVVRGSLSMDRFTLVLNRKQVSRFRLPFVLSGLSFIIVSLFVVSLAWSYAPHVHAQNTNFAIGSNENVCHGLNQSFLSIMSREQSELNMTPKLK